MSKYQTPYEQPSDRYCQNLLVTFYQLNPLFAQPHSVSVTDPFSPFDLQWTAQGKTLCRAEFKRRTIPVGKFDSLMISASKVDRLRRLGNGLLLIGYLDGLFVFDVAQPCTYAHGGRTTQFRDQYDARGERCAFIPVGSLSPVQYWTPEWQRLLWKPFQPV